MHGACSVASRTPHHPERAAPVKPSPLPTRKNDHARSKRGYTPRTMASVLRLRPGTVIGHDYKIDRMLAKGGMGAVYVAHQESTGVERALKVMHPQLLDDAKSRERFTQEARIAARIESDHVVKVLGAGIDDALETPWIAMEYIKGEDLESFAKSRGPLGLDEVLEIFRQLCHGVGAAHRLGVVHRDLKLQNILIAPAQRSDTPFSIKVLDFGISKLSQDSQTDTTAAVGSPMWMAPEQAQKGKLTPATDVWPLGLIAFRLLTGKSYWKSGNVPNPPIREVLVELLLHPLEPASARARALGGVAPPPGFDAWFARAVTRDTAIRYADANEALTGLLQAVAPGSMRPMRAPSLQGIAVPQSPPVRREVVEVPEPAAPPPPPPHPDGIAHTRAHDDEEDPEEGVRTVMRPAPVIPAAAMASRPGPSGAAGGLGAGLAPPVRPPPSAVEGPTSLAADTARDEGGEEEIAFARTMFAPRTGPAPTNAPAAPEPAPAPALASERPAPASQLAPAAPPTVPAAPAEPTERSPVVYVAVGVVLALAAVFLVVFLRR